MSPTVRYGVLGGLAIGALQGLLHYVNLESSQGVGAMIIGLVIPIVLMVMGVKAERANQEGFISFGEALKTAFFVFMICAIISVVISFLHMKTFSMETWEQITEIQKSNAVGMVEMIGADTAEIEEELEEQFDVEIIKEQNSSVGALFLGTLVAAFFGLIISLIVAAIMKKDETP